MRDFFRNRIVTVVILIATVGLAGIAIFTALRLYQLRQQPVAPNVPTSVPKAAAPVSCSAISFTLQAASPTPTPSTTPTPTPTATATPAPSGTPNSCGGTCGSDSNCNSGLSCYQGYCRNSSCPTQSDCNCPSTSTATPAPTATPQLPQTGTSLPTVAGVGTGIVLLVVSVLLAL